MSNGEQIERNIAAAQSRVAEHGYLTDDVTDRDIMLTGFGYLADHMDKLAARSITIRLGGSKLWTIIGAIIGGIVVGALQRLGMGI